MDRFLQRNQSIDQEWSYMLHIGRRCPFRIQLEKGKPESKYLEPLTIEEEHVFHFCQTEGEVNSEDILQHSGFSVVKLTMILLQLQLKGYIQETEQGRYIIKTGL